MRSLCLSLVGVMVSMMGCGDDPDPGALVTVTTAGRAGVLLDDLPASERDRAATALLARPAAFWEARARLQLETTLYRLVYRQFYYEESEGKGQLPLPPRELWEITVAAPERTTIDGHDLVVASYTFSSTLLTSVAEAGLADPALARVGGVAEEAFVLPADPDLLLERTGMACMNESGFPPNSVDTENARAFFDDTCTQDSVGPEGCHVVPTAVPACVDALEAQIGRVDATVTFERVAWSAARADEVRVGVQVPGGPQLKALREGLDDARLIYRYIPADSCALSEGCVGGTGWRRLLQFSASVANHGDTAAGFGDVSEGGAAQQHNIIELSDCHGHYHFSHYGEFSYGTGNALGGKRAFCLESTSRYLNTETSPLTHGFSCEEQGIAPGWGDDYIAGLECQWIDVTPVASAGPVTAPLTFEVNPDGFLCEGIAVTDGDGELVFEPTSFTTEGGEPVDRIACEESDGWDADNTVTRDFTVPAEGGLVTAACARSPLSHRKNCGFVEQDDEVACTPGAAVTLTCTVPAGAAPQVVRICPRSAVLGTGIACMYLEAFSTETIGATGTQLQFACPIPYDANEPGGAYSIYTSPLIEGDAGAVVTCT